jgi:hypothetical protein
MSPKIKALLNLLGVAAVITVNALANILPINGYNTGQISGFYPNYFVPAGFTFSIWSIIYILIIGYTITSFIALGKSAGSVLIKFYESSSWLFLMTSILNISWILAWHFLYLALSVVIMITFLVCLIILYTKIYPLKLELPFKNRLFTYHTIVVYLAWISVATIANFTALFVALGWQGSPLEGTSWSIIMIIIALLIGIIMVGKRKEPAFGFVLSWAFYGIYSNQIKEARSVGIAAALALSFLLALTITILIKIKKAKA